MPRQRRQGKVIDFKSWNGIPSIALGTSSATTQLGGALSFTAPATILRMRGEYSCALDGAADGQIQIVTLGITVISKRYPSEHMFTYVLPLKEHTSQTMVRVFIHHVSLFIIRSQSESESLQY